MRKFVLAVGVMAMGYGIGWAATPVTEFPAQAAGTGTVVSVSTSAWTLLPASSSLSGALGLKVKNPSTNSYSIGCTGSASSPAEAITVYDFEIEPGENPWISFGPPLSLYCVSLTAAQDITVKQYK